MRKNKLKLLGTLIAIGLIIGCGQSTVPPKGPMSKNDRNDSLLLFKEEPVFSQDIQSMIDTTPIHLLPFEIRKQLTEPEHHFGQIALKRKINSVYQLQNDSMLIQEFYPNVVEYAITHYGKMEHYIEYYDSNKVLLNSVDITADIPLRADHLKKVEFNYDREFRRTVQPYQITSNFKDVADKIYVDIEVFSTRNTPFRTVGYYIFGIDENNLIIGFESIVKVLNEIGQTVFVKTFDKFLNGAFIHSEKSPVMCLNFSSPTYSNMNSTVGSLVIEDVNSAKTLVNYQPESNEKITGSLGFQEIQDGFLYFLFGPESGKKTDQVYLVSGLIDFENRKLYKKILSKKEFQSKKEEDPAYFKKVNLSEWSLIFQF